MRVEIVLLLRVEGREAMMEREEVVVVAVNPHTEDTEVETAKRADAAVMNFIFTF